MSKRVAIVIGVLLLLTNGAWLYAALDRAVTESYRQQEEYEARERIKELRKLCSKLTAGMSRKDAMALLNEVSPDFSAFEKEGHLNTVWLSLKVDAQGKVLKVGACE